MSIRMFLSMSLGPIYKRIHPYSPIQSLFLFYHNTARLWRAILLWLSPKSLKSETERWVPIHVSHFLTLCHNNNTPPGGGARSGASPGEREGGGVGGRAKKKANSDAVGQYASFVLFRGTSNVPLQGRLARRQDVKGEASPHLRYHPKGP